MFKNIKIKNILMGHEKTVVGFFIVLILLFCTFVFAICVCIISFVFKDDSSDFNSYNDTLISVNYPYIDSLNNINTTINCSNISNNNNTNLVQCKPMTVFIPWLNVAKHLKNIYNKHIPRHIKGTHLPVKRCLFFMTKNCLYDELCLTFSEINVEKYGNLTLKNNSVKQFKIIIREDSECLCTNDKFLKKKNNIPWKVPLIVSFQFIKG